MLTMVNVITYGPAAGNVTEARLRKMAHEWNVLVHPVRVHGLCGSEKVPVVIPFPKIQRRVSKEVAAYGVRLSPYLHLGRLQRRDPRDEFRNTP